MWANIKYVCDEVRAHVPLTYFHEYKLVETELKEGKIRAEYEVFWSNCLEDTPQLVLKREGRIVRVEKIKKTPANLKAGPLPGFYRATLLHYADSKEALTDLLETRESRRSLTSTSDENAPLKSTATSSKAAKRKLEGFVTKARVHNLKNLCIEGPKAVSTTVYTEKKSASQAKASEECSQSSDEDIILENQVLKTKIEELRASEASAKEEAVTYQDALQKANEKLKILEEELKRVRKQNEDLTDLNVFWQQQTRANKLYSNPSTSRLSLQLPNSQNTSPALKLDTITLNPQQSTNDIAPVSENNSEKEVFAWDNEGGMFVVLNNELEQAQPIDGEDATQDNENDLHCDQAFGVNPPFGVTAITKNHLTRILKSVEAGHRGDSRFVKSICDVLWTREQLMNRSAAGRACPTIEGSVAKPACSPLKKEYMKALMTKRMQKEIPKPSQKEEEDRLKKINDYLRGKIKAVQREMKSKKIDEGGMQPTM